MREPTDDHPTEGTEFDVAGCLERVRRHDQAAARELVTHLYPLVMKIVHANLPRRRSDADDLVQQVYARVFEKLAQYQGVVPLEHWVARIAHNHCLNILRAQQSRPEWRMADLSLEQASAVEASATRDRAPAPGEALAAREVLELLLAQLVPKDRLIIRLLEIEDRTVREVSAETGLSGLVIRTRAFRARQRLNQLYRKLKKEDRL